MRMSFRKWWRQLRNFFHEFPFPFFKIFFRFFLHAVKFVNGALSDNISIINLNFLVQFQFFQEFFHFFFWKKISIFLFFSNSTCYHDALQKMNVRVHFQEIFLFSKFPFLFPYSLFSSPETTCMCSHWNVHNRFYSMCISRWSFAITKGNLTLRIP